MDQQLIVDHLWLPAAVVRKHFKSRDPDMVQEATMGMMMAATRYDPTVGAFRHYAWPRALGAVKDYLRTEQRKRGCWVPLGHHDRATPDEVDRVDPQLVGRVLATFRPPARAILQDWLSGMQGQHVAAIHGVDPTRVSQLKRRLINQIRQEMGHE